MGAFLNDLRYGLRMILKHPGLAAISIVALALGLGLTTTMWSIAYGVLLRPLPFEDARRIVAVQRTNPSKPGERGNVDIRDFDAWRSAQTAFEDLGGFAGAALTLSGDGRPERYRGSYLTPNVLRLLRVPRPHLGRFFTEDETAPGAAPVLILGYNMWRTRFSGDSGIIGRTLRVNASPALVIGVMPSGFGFPDHDDLWLPLIVNRRDINPDNAPQVEVFGRLKPGVTITRARQDLRSIDRLLASALDTRDGRLLPIIEPYAENVIGTEPRTVLLTMLGAVLGVLLIACSNVANLLLARVAARSKEVAVRRALGAGRWRIASQLLAEALVLSLAGALAGLGIAVLGVHLFNDGLYNHVPDVPFFVRIQVDVPVLGGVAALILLSSGLAGALPAIQATGAGVVDVLKDEGRGASSLRLGRFSRGLVIAEIALACALLIGTAFMVQSVIRRSRLDHGVPTRNVFTARLALFQTSEVGSTRRRQAWEELLRRLEALPGQHGVGLMSTLPGMTAGPTMFEVEGRHYALDRDRPRARLVAVTPGYFQAFALSPLEGRVFGAGDITGAPQVAVVTATFAARHFPGVSALGARVRQGNGRFPIPWRTIVGVVPDIWYQGDSDDGLPEVLITPLFQSGLGQPYSIAVAGDGGDPIRFADPVRRAVAELDPDQAVFEVRSLKKAIDDEGWFYYVFGALFVAFGVAALFLAAIGVYGIMAFSVTRRTQEIGVRMALGASGRDVLRLFMRQGALQVGIGLAMGVALAVPLSRGIEILLFRVDTRNPAIFVLVAVVLAATGLVATFIPARRAARVDPMVAMRHD
jgi:predicted permease